MKITTIAVENIESNVTETLAGTLGGNTSIENGDPAKTIEVLDAMVGAIKTMEREMGDNLRVSFYFGSYGVAVTGEAES